MSENAYSLFNITIRVSQDLLGPIRPDAKAFTDVQLLAIRIRVANKG